MFRSFLRKEELSPWCECWLIATSSTRSQTHQTPFTEIHSGNRAFSATALSRFLLSVHHVALSISYITYTLYDVNISLLTEAVAIRASICARRCDLHLICYFQFLVLFYLQLMAYAYLLLVPYQQLGYVNLSNGKQVSLRAMSIQPHQTFESPINVSS